MQQHPFLTSELDYWDQGSPKKAIIYTVGQKKKNWKTPTNFITNYRREMKLVSVIMDYCLLQFDAIQNGPKVRHKNEFRNEIR